MQSTLINLTYEIELKKGEKFSLPEEATKQIKPGKWLISIRPADTDVSEMKVRGHGAFLNSYAPEDEGIYDDYPTR
jgi:hypothetical protein